MKVAKIFTSYCGEGRALGMPALFVRFAGCNLSCDFCDTKEVNDVAARAEAYEFGSEQLEEIITKKRKREHLNRVVLTGGEPLIQPGIEVLIKRLFIRAMANNSHIYIAVETNGTVPMDMEQFEFYEKAWLFIACSPKPQSKYKVDPSLRGEISEYKYVVTTDLKLTDIVQANTTPIWLQPCATPDRRLYDASVDKAIALIEENLAQPETEARKRNLRLGVQAHKIWGID